MLCLKKYILSIFDKNIDIRFCRVYNIFTKGYADNEIRPNMNGRKKIINILS